MASSTGYYYDQAIEWDVESLICTFSEYVDKLCEVRNSFLDFVEECGHYSTGDFVEIVYEVDATWKFYELMLECARASFAYLKILREKHMKGGCIDVYESEGGKKPDSISDWYNYVKDNVDMILVNSLDILVNKVSYGMREFMLGLSPDYFDEDGNLVDDYDGDLMKVSDYLKMQFGINGILAIMRILEDRYQSKQGR